MEYTKTSKITIVLDGAPTSSISADDLPETGHAERFEELPAYYPGDKIRGHVHVQVDPTDDYRDLAITCQVHIGLSLFSWDSICIGPLSPGQSVPFEFACPDGPLYHQGVYNVAFRIDASLDSWERGESRKMGNSAMFRLSAHEGTKPKPTAAISSLKHTREETLGYTVAAVALTAAIPSFLVFGFVFFTEWNPADPWEWPLVVAVVVPYLVWLGVYSRKAFARVVRAVSRQAIKVLEAGVQVTSAQKVFVGVRIEAQRVIETVDIALGVEEPFGYQLGELDQQRRFDGRIIQEADRRVGTSSFNGEFELDSLNPSRDGWSYSSDYHNIQWVALITVRLRSRPAYLHRFTVPVEPDIAEGRSQP